MSFVACSSSNALYMHPCIVKSYTFSNQAFCPFDFQPSHTLLRIPRKGAEQMVQKWYKNVNYSSYVKKGLD